ncbi:hypothetical protein [Rhizobium sp. Root483D2]|uniref:hypothetical protein n=1 Tax=Rhizobium sp. Root483D2 TaxID=1736545 RepID=UPI000714941A|nr:hypothetical protein [Rhizobium sp. Root483D2]KQY22653.1 hypothetical protein ASD32_27590 [Rhizobium sp. Root483D2]
MAGWLRRMRRLTGADQACPLKIDEEATAYVAVSAFKRAAISAICVGHTKLVTICMALPQHTTRYATELLRQPHAKNPPKPLNFVTARELASQPVAGRCTSRQLCSF